MKATKIFILAVSLLATADAAEISGLVTDAATGEPLKAVNILLEGVGLGTSSDEEGKFTISGAPPKILIVSAGHIGYEIEKKRISPPFQFLNLQLNPIYLSGEEVTVTASRADLKTAPAAFSNLTSAEIRDHYHAQDMPLLLESTPGVYSYSDAGNPQGYSYLKIRGFDQKRVTVLINGIPHNDPEDHQVYWVDMPDLAANTNDIQVQRGLGYSPYGPSAFGGSVNILTTPNPQDQRLEASFGGGSFNTRKMSALFNSGVVDNTYTVYGRFSRITSDGYRDNSGFEGWSYYLSGTRYGVDNTLTIDLYGGPEKLHAAWDATPEDILEQDRTYNPIQYANTIDNFNQPHYELHHTWKLSDNLNLQNTFYYIKGVGYWEIYKAGWDGSGEYLINYGLSNDPSAQSPLVQQQWVDKDQWGWIPQFSCSSGKWEVVGGGLFKLFHSHHYGKIIWLGNPDPNQPTEPDYKDHDFNGDIWETSVFGHAAYIATDKLRLIADLQFRHLDIEFKQNQAGAFSASELNRYQLTHDFLIPKLGASYALREEATVYASAGFAQREPSQREYWGAWSGPEDYGLDPAFAQPDTIYSNGNPVAVEWSNPLMEPEEMFDLELGARYRSAKFKSALNFYWIDFRNEVIPGGGMNTGYQVTYNADKTLHRGIEAELAYRPIKALELSGNLSYARNTFESDLLNDPAIASSNIKGNTIPLFPELMLNGRVGYTIRAQKRWTLEPWVCLRYVGKQYLESSNMEDAVIDPFTVLDAGIHVKILSWNSLPQIGFKAVVNNLLNEEYETSGYYYYGNYYYPGAERNYYLELTLGL